MRFLLFQLRGAMIATLLLVPLPYGATRVALAQSLRSQSEPGKLVGMIVDPSGARIATAKILISSRRLSRDVLVNEEGFFQIDLPQGRYRVTITANGFRTARRTVFVKSNAVIALNVPLAVAVFVNPFKTRITNRWTRAAGACFLTNLVRRRVL
jgi:hypothetical protein